MDSPPSARLGGRGRSILLWLLLALFATLSTVFLSLDTTAVLLTPVVVTVARQAGLPVLPFALTTVWLANTASLLLPISNLTNLLAQHNLGGISPAQFAQLMWAPSVAAVLVPLAFIASFSGANCARPMHAIPPVQPKEFRPKQPPTGPAAGQCRGPVVAVAGAGIRSCHLDSCCSGRGHPWGGVRSP